ncbi:MAG: hypothetical protein SGPRY_000026 [Prymnesium sp.]
MLLFPPRVGSVSARGFHTHLLQPLTAGSTALFLSDCSVAHVGQAIRLGVGGEGEEQAEIASVRCLDRPSPSLSSARLLHSSFLPCDLPAISTPLTDPSIPPPISNSKGSSPPDRCSELIEAARRVPGLDASYRKARGAQQALLPTAEAGARVAGMITLLAPTLHPHEVGDVVRGESGQSLQLSSVPVVCPGEPACSARGVCDGSKGVCDCDEGWGGTSCETSLCVGGCGSGSCRNGTCACAPGFTGPRCVALALEQDLAESCPSNCNGNGICSQGQCACNPGFSGPACGQVAQSCGGRCGRNGVCNGGSCICFEGYSGESCSNFCPHNCSRNGRCSAKFRCICAMGYSASDCSVECPNRCSGHGECFDGACTCYEGYEGVECSTVQPQSLKSVLVGSTFAYSPISVLVFYLLIFLFGFCLLGYIINRFNGRLGTSAIPMWDYYAKKWRNAPLFEPVLHSKERS